jgi:hypothetical protein
MLQKIFGLKEEVTWEWRELHDFELHNLFTSPYIIRISSQEGGDE